MKNKYLFWSLIAVLVTFPLLLACGLPSVILQQATATPLPEQAQQVPEQTQQTPPTPLPPVATATLTAPTQVTEAEQAPGAQVGLVQALEDVLRQVYNQVNPSVVNIGVVVQSSAQSPFGGGQPQQGLGSGFVWDQEGHIVTNFHVVETADQISVTFSDGTIAGAELIGSDVGSDLAVLTVNVEADRLHPVQLGSSMDLQIGELVIAIGNPFGLAGTMTHGIVSALGRTLPVNEETPQAPTFSIPNVIQTDAPINPGNSGGVLVNDNGLVVGVTSAIRSPVQANVGIGFAIPSSIVQRVVPSLIETGEYQHPWLGVNGVPMAPVLARAMSLDPNQRGALIIEVVQGSPAGEAGLQGSDREADIDGFQVPVGGDVIVGIEGQEVRTLDDVVTYLALNTQVGDAVTLTILRDGEQQSVEVTLEARPEQMGRQAQQQQPSINAYLGILGISMNPDIARAMDLPSDQEGLLISRVVQGSPADEAGLEGSTNPAIINGQRVLVGGDVLVGIDGQEIASAEDLRSFLQQAEPGRTVTVTVLRDGERAEVEATLAEPPS